MTKTMIIEHVINYKNQSIHILIRKNKLSRNYKLTFDKKNIRGLVSIPKHISFKNGFDFAQENIEWLSNCLLYTSPSPRDRQKCRMPSSA